MESCHSRNHIKDVISEVLAPAYRVLHTMVKRSRPRHETDEYVAPNDSAPPSKQPRDVQHTQYEIGDPLSKESRVRTDVTLHHEDDLFTMDDDDFTCLMDLEHSADNNNNCIPDNSNNDNCTPDNDGNDDDSTPNILEHELEAAGLGDVHEGEPQNAEQGKRQRKRVCCVISGIFFPFHFG